MGKVQAKYQELLRQNPGATVILRLDKKCQGAKSHE